MEGTFGRENLSLQFAAPLFMFLENLIIVIAMHASTRTPKKKKQTPCFTNTWKSRDAVQSPNIFLYYKNEQMCWQWKSKELLSLTNQKEKRSKWRNFSHKAGVCPFTGAQPFPGHLT
jgi:hypothetical protein